MLTRARSSCIRLLSNPKHSQSVLRGAFNVQRLRSNYKFDLPTSRLYSTKKQISDLSKSTDFLHTQNILLQKNQERLTKQKLLSEATNFYERFKINTKWVLIRGNRPFSTDEIGTLFSWLILSQIMWVVLGTTTFVSLVLFTFNTVFAKEMVGKFVGNSLNRYIEDCDIQFQDALVPEWKKGCISFNKVELKTTPGLKADHQLKFSLTFNQIDITLSLRKWLSGRGLIEDMSIYGMKGDVEIKNINDKKPLVQWFSNRNYHLGRVRVKDSRITIHDKALSQDYRMSIYNMDFPQLRFKWMLIDFFNANVVSGAVNHSLFSIHKRQQKLAYLHDFEHDISPWQRITRLRLDNISVKDLGIDKSASFNWIDDGQVEIIADLMIPRIPENIEEEAEEENKYLVMDLKFKFKDLKARFPANEPKLSNGDTIVTLEELKPLVTFVNTQRGIFHSLMDIQNTNSVWNNISNVSIKKNKSYPDTTVIPSNIKWSDYEDNNQISKEIIMYHDKPAHHNNEIVLRSRIVKNMEDLQNLILFRETGVYDILSMELYVDLMKMVEEWEHRKKNDWMKVWGTTFASQIMILGLGAMV